MERQMQTVSMQRVLNLLTDMEPKDYAWTENI